MKAIQEAGQLVDLGQLVQCLLAMQEAQGLILSITSASPGIKRQRQKNQEFKVIFCYVSNLSSSPASIHETLSQKKGGLGTLM